MLHIHLRFYEELNAFIPQDLRKKRFTHTLKVQTSVKDLIESFNIPHTQVNMILVNSEQAEFGHLINDHDDVSVFPYFHRFDVTNLTKITHPEPQTIRFVVDNHLKNLARDLRMLGLDTIYNESNATSKLIALANSQDRILLTKNRNVLKYNILNYGYYVYAKQKDDQLEEVIMQFKLTDKIRFLSRCLECNTKIKSIEKEKVCDRLPIKVREKHSTFTYCPNCDRIFWKGTHYEMMVQKFEKILGGINEKCK